jgi:hypothetical protein
MLFNAWFYRHFLLNIWIRFYELIILHIKQQIHLTYLRSVWNFAFVLFYSNRKNKITSKVKFFNTILCLDRARVVMSNNRFLAVVWRIPCSKKFMIIIYFIKYASSNIIKYIFFYYYYNIARLWFFLQRHFLAKLAQKVSFRTLFYFYFNTLDFWKQQHQNESRIFEKKKQKCCEFKMSHLIRNYQEIINKTISS